MVLVQYFCLYASLPLARARCMLQIVMAVRWVSRLCAVACAAARELQRQPGVGGFCGSRAGAHGNQRSQEARAASERITSFRRTLQATPVSVD